MDRLDYLRREIFFTGADYGHFDWYRLISSLELYDDGQPGRNIVWPEKVDLWRLWSSSHHAQHPTFILKLSFW